MICVNLGKQERKIKAHFRSIGPHLANCPRENNSKEKDSTDFHLKDKKPHPRSISSSPVAREESKEAIKKEIFNTHKILPIVEKYKIYIKSNEDLTQKTIKYKKNYLTYSELFTCIDEKNQQAVAGDIKIFHGDCYAYRMNPKTDAYLMIKFSNTMRHGAENIQPTAFIDNKALQLLNSSETPYNSNIYKEFLEHVKNRRRMHLYIIAELKIVEKEKHHVY